MVGGGGNERVWAPELHPPREVLGRDHQRDLRAKRDILPGELTKPGADTETAIFRPVLLHLNC